MWAARTSRHILWFGRGREGENREREGGRDRERQRERERERERERLPGIDDCAMINENTLTSRDVQ